MTAYSGEVHPFAARFPMLPPDQLQELADDIAVNGLLHPILLSPEGVLLDGRNRLAACLMAEVDARFEVHEGEPFALILSANSKRRQMTAGQRAMSVAIAMWEQGRWDEETGAWERVKGGKDDMLADANLSKSDLARCGTILAFSQETADEVLAGTRAIRATYDWVKTQHTEAAQRQRKHTELTDNAPDLLARIDGDEFTLEMAYAAYQERDKERIAYEARRTETRTKYTNDLWISIRALSDHLASDERRELFHSLPLDFPEDIPQDIYDAAITVITTIKERKCHTTKGQPSTTSSRRRRGTTPTKPPTVD